jgi:hypothetical protein
MAARGEGVREAERTVAIPVVTSCCIGVPRASGVPARDLAKSLGISHQPDSHGHLFRDERFPDLGLDTLVRRNERQR